MATFIVNPTLASNGTGSGASPFNAWPGHASIAGGDTYLQVAGTTWAGQNTAEYGLRIDNSGTAAARTVIGVCHPQTLERITDGSQRARIATTGVRQGIRIFGANYVDIDGFEVTGVDGLGATRAVGIYVGSTSSAVSNFCRIMNCWVHDITNGAQPTQDNNAIQIFGSGHLVSNNIVENIPDDGIWLQGADSIIEFNTVRMIGTSGRVAGDCVQTTGDTTLGSGNNIVRFNYLDHSNANFKQCVIFQGHNTNSYGGAIYGNIMKHVPWEDASDVVNCLVEVQGARIFGNIVEGGTYGLYADFAVANYLATGSVYFGNIVSGSSIGIAQGSGTSGNVLIANNTVIDTGDYGVYNTTDDTLRMLNNIVYRCGKGTYRKSGATENYNCVYEIADQANRFSVNGGGSKGANTIELDPLLDDSYRPRPGSPCIGAGVYIPGARHYGGKRLASVPDIGAHRYFAAREIAADRTVRLVGA